MFLARHVKGARSGGRQVFRSHAGTPCRMLQKRAEQLARLRGRERGHYGRQEEAVKTGDRYEIVQASQPPLVS